MKLNFKPFIFLLIVILLIGCSAQENQTKDEDESKEQSEHEMVENEQEDKNSDDDEVVTIGDKTFYQEDLGFYTLMNKVKITLEMDAAKNEEEADYYKEQLDYYEHINANLQSLIELYGMTLLAEEKNYFVPDDKLTEAVKKYDEQIQKNENAVRLIEQFGKEKYEQRIEEYIRQSILRDRIVNELKENIEKDNPDVEEREVNFMLEKYFQELLMDHISTLDIDIHLK